MEACIKKMMEGYRTEKKKGKKGKTIEIFAGASKNDFPKSECRSQQKSNSQSADAQLVDGGVEQFIREDGSRQELREDVTQLVIGRDVVHDEPFVDNPVAQPHEPDYNVFVSSAAVAALPRQKQSLLLVTDMRALGKLLHPSSTRIPQRYIPCFAQ